MNNPCTNCIEQTSDCQNDCASFSEYTSEKLHEILTLCLEAKKQGHDCFFDYLPCFQSAHITIYLDGFTGKTCSDYFLLAHMRDEEEVNVAVAYLKGLIK